MSRPCKAVAGLSAYCTLNDQPARPLATWSLGSSARKQAAVFIAAADLSFEVGLVDTRSRDRLGCEGYEAVLFLDGRQ